MNCKLFLVATGNRGRGGWNNQYWHNPALFLSSTCLWWHQLEEERARAEVNCTNWTLLWCLEKSHKCVACCCALLLGWSYHRDHRFPLSCELGMCGGRQVSLGDCGPWTVVAFATVPTSAGAVQWTGTRATTPSPMSDLAISWGPVVLTFPLPLTLRMMIF